MNKDLEEKLTPLLQAIQENKDVMDVMADAKKSYDIAEKKAADKTKKVIELLVAAKADPIEQHPLANILFASTPQKAKTSRPSIDDLKEQAVQLQASEDEARKARAEAFLLFVLEELPKVRQAKDNEYAKNPGTEYKVNFSFIEPVPTHDIDIRWKRLAARFLEENKLVSGVEDVEHYSEEEINKTAHQLVRFKYVNVINKHDPDPEVHIREGREPQDVQGTVEAVKRNADGYLYLVMRNQNRIVGEPGARANVTEQDIEDKAAGKIKRLDGEFAHRSYRTAGIKAGTLEVCRGGKWSVVPTAKP